MSEFTDLHEEGPSGSLIAQIDGNPEEIARLLQKRLTKLLVFGWQFQGSRSFGQDGRTVITMLFRKLSIITRDMPAMAVTVAGGSGSSTVVMVADSFTLNDLEKALDGLSREREGQ